MSVYLIRHNGLIASSSYKHAAAETYFTISFARYGGRAMCPRVTASTAKIAVINND